MVKIIQSINNVLNNRDYGVKNAFVLSKNNVEIIDNILYYPIYFIMFIDNDKFIIPKSNKIDLGDL